MDFEVHPIGTAARLAAAEASGPLEDVHGMVAGAAPRPSPAPIDMVLHCPKCTHQHVDGVEHDEEGRVTWSNPSHRTHLCHACGHKWRPADVPTNGVRELASQRTAAGHVSQHEHADPRLERAQRVMDARARAGGAQA